MPTTEAVPAVNSPSLPASSENCPAAKAIVIWPPEPATNIPKSAKVWSLAFFNVPRFRYLAMSAVSCHLPVEPG